MSHSQDRLQKLLGQLKPESTALSKSLKNCTRQSVTKEGVGIIKLMNPPVNAWGDAMMRDLMLSVTQMYKRLDVKAVVITGFPGRFFMAGADINLLLKQTNTKDGAGGREMCTSGHAVLDLVEAGPKPIVAAINGPALGGGCELAMACNMRVAGPNARIGLVECNLGVIPGFAGTQRMPRLIGIKEAAGAITRSTAFSGPKAHKLGLVDAVATTNADMMAKAITLALEMATGGRPTPQALQRTDRLVPEAQGLKIIEGVRDYWKRKIPKMPQLNNALDAIAAVYRGPHSGSAVELHQFEKVITSDATQGQVSMFFAERATNKGLNLPKPSNRKITHVAVLGGGTMGSGIVTVLLQKGYNVILKEVADNYLNAALKRIESFLGRWLKKRRQQDQLKKYMSRLQPQLTYKDFNKCDVVIEAVLERVDLKKKIFSDLVRVCKKDAILGTNTSTIDINAIGGHTDAMDRIVGLHFFSPAHVMPLLEVIRTKHSSPQILSDMMTFAKKIGKIPVLVGNCVGFTANRVIGSPMFQAQSFLLERGVDMYAIEEAVESRGLPMGPAKLGDLSGLDIFCHMCNLCFAGYPDFTYKSKILEKMVAAKRLGQKTKKGFFRYEGRNPVPDPEVKRVLASELGSKTPNLRGKLSKDEIAEMVLFPIINESFRVLGEGMVAKPGDIDVVACMGYGWPRRTGGIQNWARYQLGLPYVAKRLREFAAISPEGRDFFMPCRTLRMEASRSG